MSVYDLPAGMTEADLLRSVLRQVLDACDPAQTPLAAASPGELSANADLGGNP